VVFHKIPQIPFPRSLRPRGFAWLVERALYGADFYLVHSHERIFRADIVTLHCIPHRLWVREIRVKQPSRFDREMIAVEEQMIRAGAKTTFLPVSTIARDMFRRAYGDLPGQWQIMHPGVDHARFAYPDREQCLRKIRDRHQIPRGAFVVLFAGMNFELKGLDIIMEAVAHARRQRPQADIRLLVVGGGHVGKYQVAAQKMGLFEAVTFTGTVHEGMEEYYRASDVSILLSAFDTFGMVVLEAMSSGLPAIISPDVGAKDIIAQGKNGFVLRDRFDANTATEILLMLAGNQRLERFAAHSVATAKSHDWSALTAAVSEIYMNSKR
jgi:UDP-glucose:(heptosyl)LPS alpha-1,3-glucosyltransferase